VPDIHDANSYFRCLSAVVEELPFDKIDLAASVLLQAYDAGHTIFLFGNGGSAALASHLACDLGKGTINGSDKRFRVLALTDNVPLMTAWANDSTYEDIFAQQLMNFVRPDDVALAISASGNSPNVLRALNVARHGGAITIGLTGYEGGKMRDLCDVCVVVPSNNMQMIEDLHLCVSHALFTCIRRSICQDAAAHA
jgi:D-sedoheptulose 7-phosphate isomerase